MRLINGNLKREQLGIFGISLFEDSSESETSTTSRQKTDSTRTTESEITSTGEKAAQEVTTLLSQEIQDSLEALVLSLTGKSGAGQDTSKDKIDDIGQTLLDRATNAAAEIKTSTDAILAEEERKGLKDITRIGTDLAQAAGGVGLKSNSFVAGATVEGRAQLTSQLASLGAQLDIQARGIETAELETAIKAFVSASGASSQDANTIAALVAQLRGATSVTTSEERQAQTQNQSVTDILDQLITGVGTSVTTGTESPSLVSMIASLGSAFRTK